MWSKYIFPKINCSPHKLNKYVFSGARVMPRKGVVASAGPKDLINFNFILLNRKCTQLFRIIFSELIETIGVIDFDWLSRDE